MNIELYSMRFISSSLGAQNEQGSLLTAPHFSASFFRLCHLSVFHFRSQSFHLSLFAIAPSVSPDAIAGSSAAIVEKFPGEIEIDSRSAPKAILRRRVSSLTFSSFLVARAVIYEPS